MEVGAAQHNLGRQTERIEGICAGKHSIANYLVKDHGFRLLTLLAPGAPKTRSISDLEVADFSFVNIQSLIDFVTERWREQWVTTDIADEVSLDGLLRRPFFILVGVDAPVSVRWRRFEAR